MGRAMLCYGVGGFAVTRISASPRQKNLAPLPGGAFSVAARCATNSAARRWGGGFAECLEPVPFGLWFRCRSASPVV